MLAVTLTASATRYAESDVVDFGDDEIKEREAVRARRSEEIQVSATA